MGLLSRMGRAATELSKYYYPFTWRNKPSIESPINEVHLNHIEDGINEMDNRILILAQDKADATDIANVFVDFAMDDTTGVMTFTRFDGSKVEHDSAVEKIALNCYLEDDNFVLELADGTKQKVSLSKFIDTYEFSSTDTIRITVNGKNISAEIPDGKITLAKLEPTIMSTIRQYTLDAQTAQGVSEQAAGTAQGWAIGGTGFEDNNAKHYASRSQRYAVGGVEEGDTEDNAKYYCQQAQAAAEQATEVAGFDGTASTVSAIDTQGVAVRKASGTGHVTITDAAEHPLLNLDIAGKSEQMVTTGAQLLDLVDMTDISAGGAAISGDSGAYTISGTGTLTGAFSANYRLDYLKNQLKPGNLTLRSDLTIPKMYVRIWDGNTVLAEMQGNSTKQITQDMIDNENVYIECFLHGNTGSTITPGTYYPMLYQSGDGTWEPYTGCKPSPRPEYPQEIVSTDVTAVTVTGANNQSKTASITLTEPLRGIGDVRDRIMRRDGVWGVERQFVSLSFNGSENWEKGGTVTSNQFRLALSDYIGVIKNEENSNKPIKIMCDRLKAGSSSNTYSRIECISSNTSGYIFVYLDDFSSGDVSAFETYLSTHPITAIFERATPTWEPLPSAAQSALNALTTYTGTTHVTITAGGPEPDVGLEYFGQPGDKVTVQDMCDSLAAPGFDDSGVVQGISGFSDFLNRMTSGMRLPSFFRDLKAGLKFVLHTGQLVNNGLCNEPGKYPLDAAYGRTLLEMIGNTEILPGGAADIVSAIVAQNSNLGMKITSGNITDIIGALPVGKYAGYYSSGATETPSSYGTFEAIVMNDSTATITAINTSNGDEFVRIRTSNIWNDWVQNIVKSTNKTSLQSPDKTHTLGIHNNGTAYLDDNKVITSKNMYAISLSTDLNTVKSPGTYVQTANSGATTALHYPVTTAGFLEVIGRTDSDWILQRYTPWDTSTQTYKRTFYQGSWRDWVTT